ncbi:hypothetical protein EDC14_103033 [Hydrogenispora ethanolica]|uniref:4Fe-4S ferredoxin-type domain-containing protein n=1 Tax=Hydrogenispora ethanolica TaxID=1082276 RepID=A0A4R1R8E6_HYDET|nr:aldo/keto reductase [Hydrogenispora ethanolica]TCL61931.1 hypothetical protein EDC14_103033 [Hydrogenispora ethanolica]
MLYRKFGKTGETVSALGFGCMRLPIRDDDPSHIDEAEAIRMIRYAIDAGVNYVDTAYPYHGTGFTHGGSSEPLVAKALKDGYRERVKLATKLPSWLIQSRADMDQYLDEQLERLETDHIDFYLVHSLNVSSWATVKQFGIAEFLDQALRDGRIKYAGFSFHDRLPLFKEIVDAYDWSFCQIQYNYLDENYQAGTEGLEYAAQRGLGMVIMEPLRGGKIVNLPQAARDVLERTGSGRTPAEWGLRWVWNSPEVSVVLSGMTTMEQVVENVKAAGEVLPDSLSQEELAAIERVKRIFNERVKVQCTACGYCMPCPVGINIPGCFSFYNDHWVFDGNPQIKAMYQRQSTLTKAAPASKCVACGRCESHCPQGIAIRDELKRVTELFA